MGYFNAPRPGADNGPCIAPCVHTDCNETKRQLATPCSYCGKKIEPGDKVYLDLGNFQHVACVWAAKSL